MLAGFQRHRLGWGGETPVSVCVRGQKTASGVEVGGEGRRTSASLVSRWDVVEKQWGAASICPVISAELEFLSAHLNTRAIYLNWLE